MIEKQPETYDESESKEEDFLSYADSMEQDLITENPPTPEEINEALKPLKELAEEPKDPYDNEDGRLVIPKQGTTATREGRRLLDALLTRPSASNTTPVDAEDEPVVIPDSDCDSALELEAYKGNKSESI